MTLAVYFGMLVFVLVFMLFGLAGQLMLFRKKDITSLGTPWESESLYISPITMEEKEERIWGPEPLQALLARTALGKDLAKWLSLANWSITPIEFLMLMIFSGFLGSAVGLLQKSPLILVVLGLTASFMPYLYLRHSAQKRRQAAGVQVAELLQFLVGALRAGFGINHALESIAPQLPSPIKEEIELVLRSMRLGLSLPEALDRMAKRIQSDELDMMVVAIHVQYDVGGNLAPILENISHTIRDRLRLKREINILTAQQRMSGYILAVLPVALAAIMYVLNPDYIMRLFAPGWVRILPITAVLMIFMGFMVIRKIVQIHV